MKLYLLWAAVFVATAAVAKGPANEKQKKDKITNMLIKLRKLEKISNKSKGPNSDWFIN